MNYFSVELILSMFNLGFNIGLPCGLILERCGPKWASLSAMVINVIAFLGFYFIMAYPEPFGGSWFWFFALGTAISGKRSVYPQIKMSFIMLFQISWIICLTTKISHFTSLKYHVPVTLSCFKQIK